ncbi:hypothetical protein HanXRQr2_Chr13g0612901 [Helianthus annuus]|uniref:Pentatricopeptide repeat protein n=1 Tax=Helianthus annuus TaxID=4232 RepID=A0A9K3EM72_HELAN|nr:hypothetical protein HanXRQr2_Chr13g0612901 [Helianthus annuus]KAJ0672968.1 hypothetical protein HanOQP8_Chr13g0503041 [Helianthus annuus]
MPQRTQGLYTGFFDVLNLVERCKVRPDLQSVANVHALALKVGVVAVSVFVQMLEDGIKFDSLTLLIVVSAVLRVAKRLGYLELVHSLAV